MKQHLRVKLTGLLRHAAWLLMVGVVTAERDAFAVCPAAPNGLSASNANLQKRVRVEIGNGGTSIVTGTANSDPGKANGQFPEFSFNQQMEIAPPTTSGTDPDNGAPCTYYSRSFTNDPTPNTYTVTVTGTAGGVRFITGAGSNSFNATTDNRGASPDYTFSTANQGTVVFTVTGPNGSANATVTFRPQLRFTSTPLRSKAGSCVGPLHIGSINGDGAAITPSTPIVVGIAITGSQVFQDELCKIPANNGGNAAITIGNAQNPTGIRVYVKTAQAQSLAVGASYDAGNNTTGRAAQSQQIDANSPTFMKLSGPSAVSQGECSTAITVTFKDMFGNTAPLEDMIRLKLSVSGKGALALDAACTQAIGNSVNVPQGSTNYAFYVKDHNPEELVVNIVHSLTEAQQSAGSMVRFQNVDWNLNVLGSSFTIATRDPAAAKRLALRLYDRLVSLPASADDPLIAQMSTLIQQGRGVDAAHLATALDGFLNITVKNMVTPLSNRNFDPTIPLNDFTATWIGVVRDNLPATELLTGNYVYVPNPENPNNPTNINRPNACANPAMNKTPAAYITLFDANPTSFAKSLSQAHQCYANADNTGIDAALQDNTTFSPLPEHVTAGLLTTRQWGREHLYAGTNRRAVEFAFEIFMCRGIHQVADSTMPDSRIRRDVDRSPADDSGVFNSSCKSCHGGLDGMAGAFAFFDSYPTNNNNMNQENDFRLLYNTNAAVTYSNRTQNCDNTDSWKMNRNCGTSPQGFRVSDESWVNYFTENQNKSIGWSAESPSSGSGPASLGHLFAHSEAFASCMAQRVFKSVCKRAVDPALDAAVLGDLSRDFKSSGYNMRRLFEKAASSSVCIGSGG